MSMAFRSFNSALGLCRNAVYRNSASRVLLTKRSSSTTATSSSSASTNPFPYPVHRNPTPHQIFHLPRSASDADIKSRYIDLVRIYHPDSVVITCSSEEAHERFQAITNAYDILRGKITSPLNGEAGGRANTDTAFHTTAAYRAMRRKRQELYKSGAVDESWKDRLILLGVVGTVLFVIIHTNNTRREVLVESIGKTKNYHFKRDQRQQHQCSNDEERLSLASSEEDKSP